MSKAGPTLGEYKANFWSNPYNYNDTALVLETISHVFDSVAGVLYWNNPYNYNETALALETIIHVYDSVAGVLLR
jgi:hypothetical protein